MSSDRDIILMTDALVSGSSDTNRLRLRDFLEHVEDLIIQYRESGMNIFNYLEDNAGMVAYLESLSDNERVLRLSEQDDNGDTVLHIAVRGKRVEMVKLLLEHGGLNNLSNNENHTPLYISVDNLSAETITDDHSVDIIRLFVAADIQTDDKWIFENMLNVILMDDGSYYLLKSLDYEIKYINNHFMVVFVVGENTRIEYTLKEFIEFINTRHYESLNVSEKDELPIAESSIAVALSTGNYELIKLLIAKGVRFKDNEEFNKALMLLVKYSMPIVGDILIESIPPELNNPCYTLNILTDKGAMKISYELELQVESGAIKAILLNNFHERCNIVELVYYLKERTYDKMSYQRVAVNEFHDTCIVPDSGKIVDMLEYLKLSEDDLISLFKDNGELLLARDEGGSTFLHVAVIRQLPKLISYLVKNEELLYSVNNAGFTALHFAIADTKILSIMLDVFDNLLIDAVSSEENRIRSFISQECKGKSALGMAIDNDLKETIELFREYLLDGTDIKLKQSYLLKKSIKDSIRIDILNHNHAIEEKIHELKEQLINQEQALNLINKAIDRVNPYW